MKTTSKAVKDSRARTGTTSTSFAFAADEKADIDALADRLGVSRKEAVLRAVRAYGSRRMSKEELIAELAGRLK